MLTVQEAREKWTVLVRDNLGKEPDIPLAAFLEELEEQIKMDVISPVENIVLKYAFQHNAHAEDVLGDLKAYIRQVKKNMDW